MLDAGTNDIIAAAKLPVSPPSNKNSEQPVELRTPPDSPNEEYERHGALVLLQMEADQTRRYGPIQIIARPRISTRAVPTSINGVVINPTSSSSVNSNINVSFMTFVDHARYRPGIAERRATYKSESICKLLGYDVAFIEMGNALWTVTPRYDQNKLMFQITTSDVVKHSWLTIEAVETSLIGMQVGSMWSLLLMPGTKMIEWYNRSNEKYGLYIVERVITYLETVVHFFKQLKKYLTSKEIPAPKYLLIQPPVHESCHYYLKKANFIVIRNIYSFEL